MTLWSPVRGTSTTHTSWLSLLWTGIASHKLCCLVVLTKECMANRWSSALRPSLTPSSVRCVRHSLCVQLSCCRLTRTWCCNGPRGFQAVSLHLHDAPRSLRLHQHGMLLQLVPLGMVLSADSTWDLQYCLPAAPLFTLRKNRQNMEN